MGHLFFYLAVVAACLLWSATCVAAATRTRHRRLKSLLVAAGVVLPALGLLPWVCLTFVLAARVGLATNWLAPTLTAFLSAIIGGVWITRAGLAERADGPVAASWPVVGLAAMVVMAKAVAFGTLLFIDNAVNAEARGLRVEAAQLMQANIPQARTRDDDAAPLYLRAFASLESDTTFGNPESPAAKPLSADVRSPEAVAVLERHAAALDLVRRAADRPACVFVRDWTRPSISLLLPEVQSLRQVARLLVLAARREAADGDRAAAVRDIVRVHRMATHAAAEPILICGLVGQALDSMALEALVSVLPTLEPADLPLLESPELEDFIGTPIVYQRHFLGEEAFGLATLADLADTRHGTTLGNLAEWTNGRPSLPSFLQEPVSLLFRCFLLPGDVAAYRVFMHRYQSLAATCLGATGCPYPEITRRTAEIEKELSPPKHWVTGLLAPALSHVMRSQVKAEAVHRAAAVLVAATRARLAAGSLPDSPDRLVPQALPAVPRDPFTGEGPLRSQRSDGFWTVYSVGPDGEDDGGPPAHGAEIPEGNDDVGLRLTR
ncbi:MAG: hypothetical protein ACKOTB_01890 [Planctomycetia bacterium]